MPVAVTLKRTVVDLGGGQTVTVDLGIDTEDQVDFTYPFPVHINVTNIGGPSAGLAMTLGVIDALDKGSLTGGRTVAATGTIDSQGNVGDVGGVPQKTVAVENAGASIFFVPVPGVQGGHDQGPAGAEDLPGVHPRPGAGHAGRPRGFGAEGPAAPRSGGRRDDRIGGPAVVGSRPCPRND